MRTTSSGESPSSSAFLDGEGSVKGSVSEVEDVGDVASGIGARLAAVVSGWSPEDGVSGGVDAVVVDPAVVVVVPLVNGVVAVVPVAHPPSRMPPVRRLPRSTAAMTVAPRIAFPPAVCHDSTVQSSATLIDAARAPEALRAPSRAFTGLCVRQGRDCDQAVVPTPRLASKPVSHYFLSYLSQTQTGPLLLVP